jgi:hypothetical protein
VPVAAWTTAAFCTGDDLRDLYSAEGVDFRLDDDGKAFVDSGGEAVRLDVMIAQGGNRVAMMLLRRYDLDQLAQSSMCREFNAVISAYRLGCRRGNKPPAGIAALYRELAGKDGDYRTGLLRDVAEGDLVLDVPQRDPDTAFVLGGRVEHDAYGVLKFRVEESLTSAGAAQHRRPIDWGARLLSGWDYR